MADETEQRKHPDWNAGAVVQFTEYLQRKHLVADQTAASWRTAVTRVLEKVEGEGWEQVNVSDLDEERLFSRFEIAAKDDYSSGTLNAYKKRFKKALAEYESWIESPSTYSPDVQRRRRSKNDDKTKSSEADKSSSNAGSTETQTPADEVTTDKRTNGTRMLRYPFPVRPGVVAELVLPENMRPSEANRLARFLEALAGPQELEASGPQELSAPEPEADAA